MKRNTTLSLRRACRRFGSGEGSEAERTARWQGLCWEESSLSAQSVLATQEAGDARYVARLTGAQSSPACSARLQSA